MSQGIEPSESVRGRASQWSAVADDVGSLPSQSRGSSAHEERQSRRLTELFGLVMMLCTLLALVSALLAAHAVTEAQHGLIGFALVGLVSAWVIHRAAKAWLGDELETMGRKRGLEPEEASRRARARVEEMVDRREGLS